MPKLLADITHEFRRHKDQADRAIAALSDEQFFARPGAEVNPVALIVRHMAGNLRSRFRDFLTSDGEKPDRDRDNEFVLAETDTRDQLLAAWEAGWRILFETLASLKPDDFDKTITIRGESHTVRQALLRGATHVAYHTGQILYLARLLRPDSPWLTVAPGKSKGLKGGYFRKA
ncbi:MAG: DUF1572 domain-containing protein [Gemmataceae bacterium]|nr:DUF1572 domain-containing protein [Gemmataceae bacterium]